MTHRKNAALILFLLLLSCGQETASTGAILSVISAGVTVNGNTPTVGMALNVGDVVATTVGAEAAIEFYNGSIVRLRENTTITIKKLTTDKDVVLKQEKGQTWNRVTKLAGINSYRVETPNTVATVRGTGFKVTVDAERTWVGVADGAVAVQRVEDDIVVAETLVEENDQAEIFFDTPEVEHNDILIEELQTDEWFEENIELDEQYVTQTYEEAGEEVPPEYVEEFAEATLEKTDEILNESDETLEGAQETIEKAEEIVDATENEVVPEELLVEENATQDETIVDETVKDAVEEVVSEDTTEAIIPPNNDSGNQDTANSEEGMTG